MRAPAPTPALTSAVQRIPLIAGRGVTVVRRRRRDRAPAAGAVERPIADVGAAVRDALRFPLAGPPLEPLVPRGRRATIVVEPPSLPLPSSPHDPRQLAIAAAVRSSSAPASRPATRRSSSPAASDAAPGAPTLESLVTPDFARRFHGLVTVHDVEADDLVEIGHAGQIPLRVNPRAPRDGRRRRRDRSRDRAPRRPGRAPRRVRTRGDPRGDELLAARDERLAGLAARALARARARRARRRSSASRSRSTTRASAAPCAATRTRRPRSSASPARRCAAPSADAAARPRPDPARAPAARSACPPRSPARRRSRTPRRSCAAIAARERELDEPLDAIVIGIPQTTPILPRERPNPLLAATTGLGLALRLWRERFPLREDGTAILLHGFERHFAHPTQQPYRALLPGDAARPRPGAPRRRRARGRPRRARAPALPEGRSCHPLLPFVHWDACQPARQRLGAVVVAGCRDAAAARAARLRPDALGRRRAADGVRPRRRATRASASSSRRRTSRSGPGATPTAQPGRRDGGSDPAAALAVATVARAIPTMTAMTTQKRFASRRSRP